MYILYSDFKS